MSVAVITGASSGLGRALARRLAEQGWQLVLDARNPQPLYRTADELAVHTTVTAVAGDVTEPRHRHALAQAAGSFGGVDLLVNNASSLGPTPLAGMTELEPATFELILRTNVVAPLALIQLLRPWLRASAVVVNISSDAAIEHYPSWGGYGASKSALDHLSATLATEDPRHRYYAFDPGDMRTPMHQAAFPGEDISDRPWPLIVVPALLSLYRDRPASGRYRAADLQVPAGAPAPQPDATVGGRRG
ncbi:SDR family oxidoreductase [Jatrophihabitans telluris]|uniref:SDR family oxidoreductase n=1 Tax=Jatrophihabitans telluris TaxID=2038343 RepID=A0ABY4R444_9ACTN|nr:SDR family oxidoreductase [Jatrophihabitans telluris]UQX89835.1 SDR family oxidoreductase [Jatrophihabitans telluris]